MLDMLSIQENDYQSESCFKHSKLNVTQKMLAKRLQTLSSNTFNRRSTHQLAIKVSFYARKKTDERMQNAYIACNVAIIRSAKNL